MVQTVHSTNDLGETSLHLAVKGGHLTTCEVLLNFKADRGVRDRSLLLVSGLT